MDARILRLNVAGQPIEWLNWKEAVCLYARNLVAWTLGGVVKRARGGYAQVDGKRTIIELPAIIACAGECVAPLRKIPPLTNSALFFRDNCQCMYCGHYFTFAELSRDHVQPRSRGGLDKWENVVAAFRRCNQRKGQYLLNEVNLELLALPYCPNPAEYLALINNQRIRDDQMAYLKPAFSQFMLARN